MRTLGLYTAYGLEPGGGERYLLSIAEAFRGEFAVFLITPEQQPPGRLEQLASALGLRIDHVVLLTLEDAGARPPFDVTVVMANEALPPIPGLGAKNYYLCQFPFPSDRDELTRRLGFWADYDAVVVYSDYARLHTLRALQSLSAPEKPVRVINPPVTEIESPAEVEGRIPGTILSVARFAPEKRQDLLIAAFAALPAPGCVLHLAGAVNSNEPSRNAYDLSRALTGDLPIVFHPNAARTDLGRLYAQSACYWHGTGLGADRDTEAEKFEHFGISVVEAMASGCIPFVLDHGGPAAIVTSGKDGWIFRSPAELTELTAHFLTSASSATVREMRAAAQRTARKYRFEVFADNWKDFLGREAPPV